MFTVQRSVKPKLPLSTRQGPCGSAFVRGVAFWLPRLAPQLRDRLSVDSHRYGTSRGASRRDVYLSFSAVNSSGGIPASGEDFAGLFHRGRALGAAVGRRLRPSLRTGVLRRRFLAGILRSSIQAMI